MITFEWKPSSQIPTEHWDKNYAISPSYLVRCGQPPTTEVEGL